MKNKAYFINQLCKLRNLDPEGEEAKELEELKIVDILIEIKMEKESRKEVDEDEDEDEDEELTFSRRAGCRN